MILLRNKSDNTKSILIALDDNDHKVLEFMFNNHIVWGFYRLIHVGEKNDKYPIVKQLKKKFPTVKAIAQLSCPDGFVPKYQKEEVDLELPF